MELSKLQIEIEKDNIIGDNLVTESMKIPSLHGKYLTLKSQEYLMMKNLEMQLDSLELERWLFYTGKATPEQYKAERFELKLLKTDVDIFMKSDKKIQDIRGRVEVQKMKVTMCDEMIRQLNQRSFIFKNVIETRKFENGVM